jgi:hypothetical protein
VPIPLSSLFFTFPVISSSLVMFMIFFSGFMHHGQVPSKNHCGIS